MFVASFNIKTSTKVKYALPPFLPQYRPICRVHLSLIMLTLRCSLIDTARYMLYIMCIRYNMEERYAYHNFYRGCS
jgi:hypothetical protein